jgi:hypothetical protein
MTDREPLLEVTAWGGLGTAMSTIGFSAVRAWLESASITLAKLRPDTRLVNATEGGARIAGFEECRLAELLATLPERNISAASLRRDAERVQAPLSSEQLAGWCREQATLARAVRHAARRLRRLGEASLVALDQNQPSKISKGFQKLEVAELALKQAVRRMPFVDAWTHAEIDRAVEASGSLSDVRDDHDSARRSVSLELSLGSVIERGAGELERQLRELGESFAQVPEEKATNPRT